MILKTDSIPSSTSQYCVQKSIPCTHASLLSDYLDLHGHSSYHLSKHSHPGSFLFNLSSIMATKPKNWSIVVPPPNSHVMHSNGMVTANHNWNVDIHSCSRGPGIRTMKLTYCITIFTARTLPLIDCYVNFDVIIHITPTIPKENCSFQYELYAWFAVVDAILHFISNNIFAWLICESNYGSIRSAIWRYTWYFA